MLEKYHLVLAVAAFILDAKGQLLIVKKSPHEKVDAGLWTIPGGKVNPNEHIIDALKREVKEEVNLEIIDYQWLDEDVFTSGGKYFHGEHFLCHVKNTKPIVLERNLLEYRWVDKKTIKSFSKRQFHPNIIKEILRIFQS